MSSRRLLLGLPGGPIRPPADRVFALTSAPSGGWTQTQGPHAAYYNGLTYFAYYDISTGNVEVRSYDHASRAVSAATVLHAAFDAVPYDSHAAPSLWIRSSDHRIMVFYCGHNGSHFYQRVSVDPEDIGSFGTETDIASSLGGSGYSYPYVGELADGSLWLGFRENSGSQTFFDLAKSLDDGATWSARTRIAGNNGYSTCYFFVHFGETRIDLAITNGNGVTGTHISTYHAYWEGGGAFHNTDGSSVSGAQPWGPWYSTLVYDGSAYPNSWPTGMTLDETGAPVILLETVDTANGHAYGIVYCRWDGAAWVKTTVATFNDTGLALVSHSALDESGRTIWVAKPASGVFEMFRYTTDDEGATFEETQLTSGSAIDGNFYPVNVANRAAGLGALWLKGTYSDTDNNDLGISGLASRSLI